MTILHAPVRSAQTPLHPADPVYFREHVAHTGCRRIAAYLLAYVIYPTDDAVFTIALMEHLVAQASQYPGKRVELDRRIRQLPAVGWRFANYRTDPTLRANQHRLLVIGDHIWEKSYRWPTGVTQCPGPVKRAVFVRDGRICQICGISDQEPYLGVPWRRARMTIGRIVPGSRGGRYTIENCQVECSDCNEAARDQYDDGSLDPAA
jgi:5-methylcytosine-specific restriction endonuclease McrA